MKNNNNQIERKFQYIENGGTHLSHPSHPPDIFNISLNIRQLSVISAGFPCSHLDELHITWSRKQICRAKREWVRYFPLLANKSHQKIKKSARTFRIYMLLRLASGKGLFISIFNMDHATNATLLSNATLTVALFNFAVSIKMEK